MYTYIYVAMCSKDEGMSSEEKMIKINEIECLK